MDVDPQCVIEEYGYRSLDPTGGSRGRVIRHRLAAAALCTRCECCLELHDIKTTKKGER